MNQVDERFYRYIIIENAQLLVLILKGLISECYLNRHQDSAYFSS
jgi:hypothetical protein